jgi:TrmH family RNA methyltransferase
MITSVRNPRIQGIRSLQGRSQARREAGSFVVEGVRLVEEVLSSGWKVRCAYYGRDLVPRGQKILETLKAQDVEVVEVSESVMKVISDTKTPQGILLEVEWKELSRPAQPSLVLILDGVADPGNLGTLLRSAAAAGADLVLLAPGSADAFAPKVLRSGMGAHFRLPIREMDWAGIATLCKSEGLAVFLAEAGEGQAYDRVDLTKRVALIIGGEAHGTSVEAQSLKPEPIHIPMPGQIESLNAAIAGSLLLFEVVRQRRAKAGGA